MRSNSFFIFFALLSLLILCVLELPWTPHFPATGHVFYQPKWILIHAPVSAVMFKQNYGVGAHIKKAQGLAHIQPISSLLYQDVLDSQFQFLQKQFRQIQQESDYQLNLLKHFSRLAKKKILSEQDFHEKQGQYQKLQDRKLQLGRKISSLKQKRLQILQAPVSGEIVKWYVREGEILDKGKKLLMMKPEKFHYWVQLSLPIELHKQVFIGQKVRLAWVGFAPFKEYPIQALVQEISPYIYQEKLNIKAKIINSEAFASYLRAGLSLDAYLLGPTQPVWRWIDSLLKGV